MQRFAHQWRLEPLADHAPRGVRRLRVVALYGGWLPIVPLYTVIRSLHASVLLYVALVIEAVAFACFCYGFVSLLQRTLVNAPNLEAARLDERERERRDWVVLRAFRTLGMLSCVAPLWVTAATTSPRLSWLRDPDLLAFAAWSVVILAMTLPTAMLAWSEPDPLDA